MKRRQFPLSSVRARLIMILALGSLLFALYFIWGIVAHHDQQNHLFDNRLKSKVAIFNLTLKNSSTQLQTFANDYTYWDDMASFADGGGKNTDFATENIEPGLSTYGTNAVWVYSAQFKPIYNTSNLGDKFEPQTVTPIRPGQITFLFAHNGIYHYYVQTPMGIFEIYAASIHPTNDPDRKTAPHGYFFTGKLLNRESLDAVGTAVEGRAEVLEGFERANHLKSGYDVKSGNISFGQVLKDFKDQTIGALVANYKAADLRSNIETENKLIFAGTIILSLVGVLSLTFLIHLVFIPMAKVQKALTNQDERLIHDLLGRSDEFGSISRLISESFAQQKLLAAQKGNIEHIVTDRTKELENERSTLKTVLDNLPVGVHVVEAPSGKTITLNEEGLRLLGRTKAPPSETGNFSQPFDVIKENGVPYPEEELPMNITLRESKRVVKDDLVIRRPDGSRIFLRVITTPIRSLDGSIHAAAAVFEDISKTKADNTDSSGQ